MKNKKLSLEAKNGLPEIFVEGTLMFFTCGMYRPLDMTCDDNVRLFSTADTGLGPMFVQDSLCVVVRSCWSRILSG